MDQACALAPVDIPDFQPGADSWIPPALPHLRISARLRATMACRLPPFHGSMLRGALGMALRRAVCTQGMETRCRRCPARHGCTYTRVFETFVEGDPPPLMGGSIHAPRPVVIEPGSRQQRFAAGDPLPFDLILFGRAAEYHPLLAAALEHAAKTGLGARRAPFALESIRLLEHDGRWQDSTPGLGGRPLQTLRLHLLTPTRLLVHKRLERQPTFRTLTFKMARRVLEMAHFHAPDVHSPGAAASIDWDLAPLLARAEAVRIRRNTLGWVELQRYSNRQHRKIPIGGLTGTLDLEGEDLTPFLPLLGAASVTHIGKGATFGLGKVAVEGVG